MNFDNAITSAREILAGKELGTNDADRWAMAFYLGVIYGDYKELEAECGRQKARAVKANRKIARLERRARKES